MTFAAAITRELKRRGMTVYALGKATKIDGPRLYQWLNGSRSIGLEAAEKCAAALGLELKRYPTPLSPAPNPPVLAR